jgi:hypothetical protein
MRWNIDNIPVIKYLRQCKQKYIKDGIDTDSVLYEILKSRDGTTGIGIESEIIEQRSAMYKEVSQMKSVFGLFGIFGRGKNNNNVNDNDLCKPNYDSDDSDAKLSDWDC